MGPAYQRNLTQRGDIIRIAGSRRSCASLILPDPCRHQFPGYRQDDGADKKADDAMRQHAAQHADEDDKHRRAQSASHQHGLQDVVSQPHDQQIDC